ncbi:MAG: hypothetical protein KKG67_20425 [Gammaproteobacteria bacterium]|nr:hypothetical protein [Gammaproteobacteria bacterium]
MRIIRPLTITDAMITAHSVPEPAPGEALWVEATNYALGAQVIRVETHSVYENTDPGINATPPEEAPTRWKRMGPTNRYRCLGKRVQSQTLADGGMSITIKPNRAADGLAIFNARGQRIRIAYGSKEIVIPLRRRTVTGWYSYLFEPFAFRKDVVLLNIPPKRQPITITVEQTPGQLGGMGPCILGPSKDLGGTQFGVAPGIKDFSSYDEAFDGSLEIQRRGYAKTMRVPVLLEGPPDKVAAMLDDVHALMAENRGVPLVWVAGNGRFDCLTALGVYRSFNPVIEDETYCVAQYEIRGFT